MKFTYVLERDVEISSLYGERVVNGVKDFHHGIDLLGKKKEGWHISHRVDIKNKVEVVSSSGKWRLTQNEWISYYCPLVKKKVKGLFVKVESLSFKKKFVFRYIHGDSCDLKVGEVLESGNLIGRVGNSGCTTGLLTTDNPNDGVHIHLELFVDGKEVNPMDYMDVYQKKGKWYLRSRKPLVIEVNDEKKDDQVIPPPVVEVDSMISVKESEWKKLNQDLRDCIGEKNSVIQMFKDKEGELKSTSQQLVDKQLEYNSMGSDIKEISRMLGVEYILGESWEDQKWKFIEAVARIGIRSLSNKELLFALLGRLFKLSEKKGGSEGIAAGN